MGMGISQGRMGYNGATIWHVGLSEKWGIFWQFEIDKTVKNQWMEWGTLSRRNPCIFAPLDKEQYSHFGEIW
jgi:hypothetical protein